MRKQRKLMKNFIYRRISVILLCVVMTVGSPAFSVMAAADWPTGAAIEAEGGILMDADTGTILYEKNMHTAYFPASITKILTALIVIENCRMDEMVTFSHEAVFGVEKGSSSAALDVGDRLSVRDCLYAMVLKSANEAANALAEHTAGSVAAFAEMMNEKARSLGCTDSHFNNPSGLNDPNHYTSAHDMALIAQAAFRNETFVEIDSALYYDLPVTKRNKEGLRIYPGHRMLKKNAPQYYPGIIGGKTGYTSLAGNTLVTCAERSGMRLITVVLNGHQTHYSDTKRMLDFGFQNFKSVNAADIDTTYARLENDMTIAGLPTTDLSVLQLKGSQKLVLPNHADYAEVTSGISYELSSAAPANAVAEISYRYGERPIGSTWLVVNEGGTSDEKPAIEVTSAAGRARMAAEGGNLAGEGASPWELDVAVVEVPVAVWIVLGTAAVFALLVAGSIYSRKRRIQLEQEKREQMKQRREARLKDIGISQEEFERLVDEKRGN